MATAAVHAEHDRFGTPGIGVLGPAIARHHREHPWGLLEHIHQDRTAGDIVITGTVALGPAMITILVSAGSVVSTSGTPD